MAANFTLQVCTIAVVTAAAARGDLTQKIVRCSCIWRNVNTINDMIDQLAIFADKVKKVHERSEQRSSSAYRLRWEMFKGFGRRLHTFPSIHLLSNVYQWLPCPRSPANTTAGKF